MKVRIIMLCIVYCCFQMNAQHLNKEVIEDGTLPFLFGEINRKGLQGENYATWFNENYNYYEADTEITAQLKPKLKDYSIILFMGTWCDDSQFEVPAFYKILDDIGYPIDQLTAYALNEEKEGLQQEEAGLNIVRVPTFIILKDGKEVNRIIELPIETLEKDLLNIITTNTYKPNYFDLKKE